MESVKALYDRAVEEAGRQGVPVPFIWEEVEGLYKRLMVDNRERRLFAALLAAGVPYDSTGRAVLASGRHAGDSLPVARATEDRQADSPIAWQGIADLTLRLNAGEDSDAAGILRFTGLAAAPTETAAAIVSCLREGLHEEGGTIIVYAAQRAHREVMEIAKGLIDGSHAAGAANLLELTLAG